LRTTFRRKWFLQNVKINSETDMQSSEEKEIKLSEATEILGYNPRKIWWALINQSLSILLILAVLNAIITSFI
jgi:hypothetical protein